MRRQFIRTLIAFVLIITVLIIPAYAESAVITGSKVNLRAGPGTNYYIAATIERETAVDILNRYDPSWYYVSYNGIEGFVSSAYLSTGDNASVSSAASSDSGSGIHILPTDTAEKYSTGSKGYINSDYVRFRSGPGSNYSIVGEYGKGKTIEIVTTVGDWIAGYIDGNPGYIHKDYVTIGTYTQPSAAPSSPTGGITVVSPADIEPDTYLPTPNESAQNAGSITVVSPAPAPTPTPKSNVFYADTPQPTQTPAVTALPVPVSADGREAYVYGTYVRFRKGPGTNYSIIGTYNTGKEAIAYANAGNGWVFCRIDGQEGYIHGDYLYVTPNTVSSAPTGTPSDAQTQSITVINASVATPQPAPTQQKKGYISGNNVRVRSSPSMTSKILGELFYGNEVIVTGYADGWTQISVNGTTAYVYSDYVKEGSYITVSGSSESRSTPVYNGPVSGQDVVNFACQYLGAPYTWGGTSPETGFDCSGFVSFVYAHFGKTLNRVASDQAKNGTHVDTAGIQPGDIICFYSGSSYIGHVGIYIGGNKFIHASNSTTGVIISDLSGYYSSRGYEIRRIT